jgi:hypothetical protein
LPNNLDEAVVPNEWLNSGDIKGETESTLVAAQDQDRTNCLKNKSLKEEAIDRLTSGCPILAKKYLMRHDKVCADLHYSICKTVGIETTGKMVHTHTHARTLTN